MFLGTYQTTFSGKRRVILPKKFRVELKNIKEVVLTRGLDQCIWGFDTKDWEKQARLQLEIPITERKGIDLRRFVFSGAEISELDSQGRFVIPLVLLTHAKVKEKVLIVGAGDHFEIWNPKDWQKTLKVADKKIGSGR